MTLRRFRRSLQALRSKLNPQRVLRRLLFAGMACLFFLLIFEGIAQLLPDPWEELRSQNDPQRSTLMIPDATRLWRMAEGQHSANGITVRTDADGFRQSQQPGPPDAPLILTLGDSSIFGHGLPDGDTLHDQLQAEMLAAQIPVRVLCGATPGYSTVQTLVWLEEAGWARQPQLLVIGSLWSDNNFEAFRDADLMGRSRDWQSRSLRFLSESALFRQVRYQALVSMGRPTAQKVTWPEEGAMGYRRVTVEDYALNLQSMVEAARDRGIGVVFLGLSNALILNGLPLKGSDWEPYFAVQQATAQAYGLPRVDATEVFAAAHLQATELFLDKMHPNATGQKLLAQALKNTLLTAGWPQNPLLPSAHPNPIPIPTDTADGKHPRNEHSLQHTMIKQFVGEEVYEGPPEPQP